MLNVVPKKSNDKIDSVVLDNNSVVSYLIGS